MLKQEDVRWQGHALECRVYAEDPEKNFLPSPGKITKLRTPSGPGVRDDSGVFEGWEVPLFYDPMISKLATHGATRDEAIKRMRRALREYYVGGIRTTIPFFQAVLEDAEFCHGAIDTGFIARYFERRSVARGEYPDREGVGLFSNEEIAAAMVAAYDFAHQPTTANTQTTPTSKWKVAGRLAALGNK